MFKYFYSVKEACFFYTTFFGIAADATRFVLSFTKDSQPE